jgi:hypothetical protein
MPPNEATGNKIGLGVGYDDPGDSTLRYMRELNTAARSLMKTWGELGQMKVQIPSFGGQHGQPELFSQQSVNEQKRRISDVTQHTISEGRRLSDTMTQLANKTNEELKRMALVFQGQGHTQMVSQIDKVLQERSGAPIVATQEELNRVRNPDPNRFYTGKHLGWPAKKGEGTPANIPTPAIVEAESRGLTPEEQAEEFRKRTIAQHVARKARQGIITDYEFQQRSTQTVGSLLGEKQVGRGEVDLEFERRERRRVLNERINERYEAQQEQQRVREQSERTYAADMQRRTHAAEQAATRAGYRSPEEQSSVEQERVRAYSTQYAPLRAARQRRVAEQAEEQRKQEWLAEQNRRVQEAEEARRRLAISQPERDLENRVIEQRKAREEGQRRAARREERRGYESQGQAPTQGPDVPDEVRIRNTEATKKAQAEIRAEVKKSQQTFNEFSAEAGKDLDNITQKSSTMASQFTNSSRRYSGQIKQDAREMGSAFNTVFMRAEALRGELARPANMRRSTEEIERELARLRADMEKTIAEANRLKMAMAEQGTDNPFENSVRRRGLFGLGGHGGLGSALGTMAMYGGLYRGISAMENLVTSSLQAAKAQSEAESMMAAATSQAGKLASENEGIVKSLQTQAGLSRTVALETGSVVQRLTSAAGTPGKERELASIISNIGISRGVTGEKLPQLFEQAMSERGRFTQEYLGKSQEQIYRDYAMRHRESLETGYEGGRRTLQQDVSSLSDMEKRRAVIEEIERRQGEFAGNAALHQETLAGQMERVSAMWSNVKANLGQQIMTSRTMTRTAEFWSGAEFGSGINTDNRAGTGPGGMLTQSDIAKRKQAAILSRFAEGGAFPGIEGDITEDKLRQLQQAQFMQLQKSGRVIYRDAQGKEYSQNELDRLSPDAKSKVMGNFNVGDPNTFRIQGDKEYAARLEKAFNEQLKVFHEMQAAEENFTYQMQHRTAALAQLRSVEDALPSTAGQVGGVLGQGNAFVKPMIDLSTAVDRVKQQWGGFSDEVQHTFIEFEALNATLDIQKTKLDNTLTAQRELQEAKKLELTATLELTGAEERRLRITQAQATATKIPRLLMEANVLDRGFALPQEERSTFMQTVSLLRGLEGSPFSLMGRSQGRIARQALRDFSQGIPQQALYSNDPAMRGLRHQLARANRDEALDLWQNIQDETQKARVGDMAAKDAQALVNQLPGLRAQALAEGKRQGLTGEALKTYERNIMGMYRGQMLAITGQLGERELTPGLREARIGALREDAAARFRMEEEAQHTRQQTMTFIAQILAEIQSYRKQIGQGGATGYEVSVKVENKSQADIDEKNLKELSTGFAAEQANRQTRMDALNPYQGGLIGGGF